jgi:hypothetical protein
MFIQLRTHVVADQNGNAPVTQAYVNPKMITHMVWGTAQRKFLKEGQPLRDVELVPITYIYMCGGDNNFLLVQESPDEIRKLIDLIARH